MAITGQKKDPAAMQTAAGYPEIKSMDTDLTFSIREKEALRTLGKRVAEIAARPVMAQKARLWTAHNDLKTDEPTVFADPENGWNEIIPAKTLVTNDPLARVWEMALLKQIYWADEIKDDKVIEAAFDVPYSYSNTGWGLQTGVIGGENNGSYKIKQAIEDYERDFDKLHHPQFIIDHEQSERVLELAAEVFEGILNVRRKGTWWWSLGMTLDYIALRGLEDFMMDMVLEPDWVHRMMNLLCEGKLEMLNMLEREGLLPDNTGATYVGSGGFGYTEQLPQSGFSPHKVRTADMWGFCESQETVGCGPDLYEEFIFPYHNRILERFGLNCYGCCEGYDDRWKVIKKLPRLRRISVSPWSDWATVPSFLGKDYIASVKLSPTPLATPKADEDTVRADARKAARLTEGGIAEFIMKDNHTLGNNPRNLTRWVEIMREEIDGAFG